MDRFRISTVAASLAAVIAIASPASAEEPQPKSNMFARAKVLSKNALSITIRHSEWGQHAAYQFASDHCASFGKLAVQTTSSIGIGPDTTTTWICQDVPPNAAPTQPVVAPAKAPQ
jgi:hypothetical protein